jgi:hypothetical protein
MQLGCRPLRHLDHLLQRGQDVRCTNKQKQEDDEPTPTFDFEQCLYLIRSAPRAVPPVTTRL